MKKKEWKRKNEKERMKKKEWIRKTQEERIRRKGSAAETHAWGMTDPASAPRPRRPESATRQSRISWFIVASCPTDPRILCFLRGNKDNRLALSMPIDPVESYRQLIPAPDFSCTINLIRAFAWQDLTYFPSGQLSQRDEMAIQSIRRLPVYAWWIWLKCGPSLSWMPGIVWCESSCDWNAEDYEITQIDYGNRLDGSLTRRGVDNW
jgi:hypothetical protein